MKCIVKNILKEEYDTKLKDFVYNYFDKKINSGKWRWVEINNEIYLIENENNIILLELEISKDLWVYKEIRDKFTSDFSIEWGDFKPIITSYVENKLNIEKINTVYVNATPSVRLKTD